MSEELHWDNRKMNENLLAENKALKRFISRGGFIQDRNGKWCKDGDKVRYKESEYGSARCAVLEYSKGCFFVKRIGDGITDIYYACNMPCGFELIKPCEPDICKDFKEE